MEYYSAIERMHYWYMQWVGQLIKVLCWVEETSLTRLTKYDMLALIWNSQIDKAIAGYHHCVLGWVWKKNVTINR